MAEIEQQTQNNNIEPKTPDFLKEPKKEKKEKKTNLTQQRSQFQGANKRNETMQFIMQLCRENCPKPVHELVCILSFRTGLTPRKIKEDYIDVLVSVHALQIMKNQVEMGSEAENA